LLSLESPALSKRKHFSFRKHSFAAFRQNMIVSFRKEVKKLEKERKGKKGIEN